MSSIEIKPPSPHGAKPVVGKNALKIFLTVIGIILIILLALVIAVARTGIVEIPVISPLVYTRPVPVRDIQVPPMDSDAFKTMLANRVRSQLTGERQTHATISFSEQEGTAAIESAIQQALRNEDWTVKHIQLAIEPTFLEMNVQIERGIFHIDARVRFLPVIENGGVRFEPTDVQIGDYPIDPKLAMQIAGSIFSRDLGRWTMQIGNIQIQKVTLGTGSLSVDTLLQLP